MKPGYVGVAVACALILFGAGYWSRSLVNDVPTPTVILPSPSLAPLPPVATPPAFIPAPRPPAPTPPPQAVAPAPTPSPSTGEPQLRPDDPMANKQPVQAPALKVPDEYQEDPNSPYAGKSRELEYAELLLHERKLDAVRLRSAHDVFQRCVQQEPDNERCQDDLALAAQQLRRAGLGTREKAQPPPPALDDVRFDVRKRGIATP